MYCVRAKLGEGLGAADLIRQVIGLQPFADGDRVVWLVLFRQLDDGLVDDPVRLQVEVGIGQQIA